MSRSKLIFSKAFVSKRLRIKIFDFQKGLWEQEHTFFKMLLFTLFTPEITRGSRHFVTLFLGIRKHTFLPTSRHLHEGRLIGSAINTNDTQSASWITAGECVMWHALCHKSCLFLAMQTCKCASTHKCKSALTPHPTPTIPPTKHTHLEGTFL